MPAGDPLFRNEVLEVADAEWNAFKKQVEPVWFRLIDKYRTADGHDWVMQWVMDTVGPGASRPATRYPFTRNDEAALKVGAAYSEALREVTLMITRQVIVERLSPFVARELMDDPTAMHALPMVVSGDKGYETSFLADAYPVLFSWFYQPYPARAETTISPQESAEVLQLRCLVALDNSVPSKQYRLLSEAAPTLIDDTHAVNLSRDISIIARGVANATRASLNEMTEAEYKDLLERLRQEPYR